MPPEIAPFRSLRSAGCETHGMGHGPPEPEGGWWQDENGKWRQGGRPDTLPAAAGKSNPVSDQVRRSGVGVAALVIAFGAIVGGVSGCAATFPLLSGTDADAFSY